MDTRFTVADCRAALYTEVDATDINSALFLPALNEVVEFFTYNGAWKGNTPKVTIPASDGFFTLPRWYSSVLTLRYQRVPRPIFSQFYEFSESGPGELLDTDSFYGVLADMGDGFATQSDIATAGTLRVTIGGAGDAAKVIRLYGTDASGNVIYDTSGNQGINLTTANPSADTTQIFATVTGIQAPANMTLPWTLSVVNGGIPTQIGSYYPGETRPSYKRYRVGKTDEAIHTICRRRFIPLVAETDWVIPGTLRALRYGLKGLAFEKAGQLAEADACFTRALGFLNDEAKASRGGARPMLNITTELSRGVQIGA
jgi:hypothetical protein